MANQEHLEILMKGVDVWNKWRKDNPDVKVDLSGANIRQNNPLGKHPEAVGFFRKRFFIFRNKGRLTSEIRKIQMFLNMQKPNRTPLVSDTFIA